MPPPRSVAPEAIVAPLKASARWILVSTTVGALMVLIGLINYSVDGFASSEMDELIPEFGRWAFWVGLIWNGLLITLLMRFAWPLLSRAEPADDLVDASFRRLSVLWRVLGAMILLNVLASLALVVWILGRMP